jgi:hypothetical protein
LGDVAIVGGECVSGDAGDDYGAARIFQPQKIVLQFRRPVLRKRPFDTRASHPAAIGVAVGCGNRGTRANVGNGEIASTDPAAAKFAVEEQMIKRPAKAGRQSRHPSIVGAHPQSRG